MRHAARRAFGFGVLIALTTVPAGTQRGVSLESRFAELFDAYRHGHFDTAADLFARWPASRIRIDARLPPESEDVRTIAALALFHTDAAMRGGRFGSLAPDAPRFVVLTGWGFNEFYEPHSYAASQLVNRLADRARAEDDANIRSFVKSWYILAVSYCVRMNRRACHEDLIDRGEYDVEGDNDPEYLLLIGSRDEPPRWSGRGRLRRMPLLWTDPRIQQSRWAFQRALERDSALVESRLRLGRIYWVSNERQRAERELTRARDDARATQHVFTMHLAPLFLGELCEEQGRFEEAIDYFREAVAVMPHAHTASIALGQVLVRTGRGDEGWTVGRTMFGIEGPGIDPAVDPYAIYPAAQSWQGARRLDAMRKAIRQ